MTESYKTTEENEWSCLSRHGIIHELVICALTERTVVSPILNRDRRLCLLGYFDTKHGGIYCKMPVFAQEYDVWFSDQHKWHARVTFYVFAFGRIDLRYSKLFLKAISKTKKSPSEVKIGQIVQHAVLFLNRTRHLGYPAYVICCGGTNSVWDANIGFQPSLL